MRRIAAKIAQSGKEAFLPGYSHGFLGDLFSTSVFPFFLSILLLSNVITALSSFFLARDLDLLVAAPVDWLRLYGAKLFETCVHSSWMVVLLAVPMFAVSV